MILLNIHSVHVKTPHATLHGQLLTYTNSMSNLKLNKIILYFSEQEYVYC